MAEDTTATPPTAVAALAREVVETWGGPALTNHCLRAFVFARTLPSATRIAHDEELLYCAAMLHDLGTTPQFDAERVPFEDAGGSVGWVFAAAAGWPASRRRRIRDVIRHHAWSEVDPAADPEGYLLEAAPSLDVAGVGSARWTDETLHAVIALPAPRLLRRIRCSHGCSGATETGIQRGTLPRGPRRGTRRAVLERDRARRRLTIAWWI